tara:strand:+ start:73 stop:867 length:795 start_codon:yes stop_codon:yes gene_type:complete
MAPGVTQLAGRLLPYLQKAIANPAMTQRVVGVGAGALPSLLQGNIPGAIVGGGFGGLSTLGLGGLAGNLSGKAGNLAAGLVGSAANPAAGVLASKVAQAATPIAGGLLANRILGRAEQTAAGNIGGGIAQSAGALLGYKLPSGEFVSLGPAGNVGGQFGEVPPIGSSPLDVLNPAGRDSARRVGQIKDAETLRDTINMVLPTVEKFSDRSKERDLQRNLAAAGVRANIEANVEQLLNAQKAIQQMGADAQRGAVNALSSQYNYS